MMIKIRIAGRTHLSRPQQLFNRVYQHFDQVIRITNIVIYNIVYTRVTF
jgi:hypothetical protein